MAARAGSPLAPDGRRSAQAARSAYDPMAVHADGALIAAQPGPATSVAGLMSAVLYKAHPGQGRSSPAGRDTRGIGRDLAAPPVAYIVTLSDVQGQGKRAPSRLMGGLAGCCLAPDRTDGSSCLHDRHPLAARASAAGGTAGYVTHQRPGTCRAPIRLRLPLGGAPSAWPRSPGRTARRPCLGHAPHDLLRSGDLVPRSPGPPGQRSIARQLC